MHNGRDEETPEVREGVVLPAQSEPWDVAPVGGQPWGQPPQQLPQGSYSPFDGGYVQQPQPLQPHQPPQPQSLPPLPDSDATQFFPPYPQAPAPADATQMLPPYPQGMPQTMPPVADATQILRPVPAELPPEAAPFAIRPGAPGEAEPTQHLPRFDDYGYGGPQSQPQQGQPQPQQPQDDFAHLYRQEGAPPAPPAPQAAPYQQPYQQQSYEPQSYEPPYAPPPGGRKKLSPAAVIGIVVAGCAVAGLAAGALLSGGGGDAQASPTDSPSSAASTAASSDSGSGASVAEQQAKKLDALLKTSGSSRAAVISAVASIQSCQNAGTAASDLRSAATQRTSLVTQLGTLAVDQLPNHQALTDALTKAWNASAEADTHYAAWGDQVANDGNKYCKHGSARNTGQTSAGTRASGTASQNKKTAVRLWNTIAKKYGLTQRSYTQL
ncbi:MAG: hypothetical protein QOF84_3293 [Streptomyces sp.]|nr:hypothetical protein [Streptomyces sp.]